MTAPHTPPHSPQSGSCVRLCCQSTTLFLLLSSAECSQERRVPSIVQGEVLVEGVAVCDVGCTVTRAIARIPAYLLAPVALGDAAAPTRVPRNPSGNTGIRTPCAHAPRNKAVLAHTHNAARDDVPTARTFHSHCPVVLALSSIVQLLQDPAIPPLTTPVPPPPPETLMLPV